MDDEEGCRCFNYFIYLLQKNILSDMACFRAPCKNNDFINRNKAEVIVPYEKAASSVIRILTKNHDVVNRKKRVPGKAKNIKDRTI